MKINIKYWMRVIHRDLGFLMVGITLVYAISGMLLNHMNGKDPAYTTEHHHIQLSSNLSKEELTDIWKTKNEDLTLRKITIIDETLMRLYINGGIGMYNRKNGELEYQTSTKHAFIYWINKLHYNKLHGWSWMGDFFAISLIFFAISGLWMVPKKNGIKGKGKWYLLAGVLIPIVYIILNS